MLLQEDLTISKEFLKNDENKKQLCQLLLKVWSSEQSASRLEKTSLSMIVVEGKVYSLTSQNGKVERNEVFSLYSNQEETDTRVVIYLAYAAAQGYLNAVVRTPDTDIFMILLYHCNSLDINVFLDTGSGKHRQLINMTELARSLGQEYCSALLAFYVFTGEDCTSAFKGKGKITPLKKLEKNPRFQRIFASLGDEWVLDADIAQQLETFTCIMYGDKRETSVDKVRAKLLRKMVGTDKSLTSKSKVDFSCLPPCWSALEPRLHRVNHRVALYKRANQPIIERPAPYDDKQGWMLSDGFLTPIWSYGPVLPTSMVDLLNTIDMDDEDDEEEEDDEFGDEIESDDDDDDDY